MDCFGRLVFDSYLYIYCIFACLVSCYRNIYIWWGIMLLIVGFSWYIFIIVRVRRKFFFNVSIIFFLYIDIRKFNFIENNFSLKDVFYVKEFRFY